MRKTEQSMSEQRNSVNICETVNLDCFLSTKDLGEN